MKLIPCPHCGNELDTNSDSYSRLGKFYLSCMSAECGYTGPIRKTLEEAITATNTRSADPLLKEMAEALAKIVRCLSHGLQDCRASITAKAMLQKYHEQIK